MGANQAARFGISVVPRWESQDEILDVVSIADRAGLELVGIQDHPYQWRFHDTWTLIAFLAGRTQQISFFPDVASLPLRPPAILAKSVATLDVLTGGRVELGLGAGAFWEAIGAMGGSIRSPGEAVEATEEAIDVIRLVWSGERGVKYDGNHYRLSGLHTGPKPSHDIEIWVGASGPRMMDLIGRKADGWVPSSSWAPPEKLDSYLEQIYAAASTAGRDADEIRVVYNVNGSITDDPGDTFYGPPGKLIEDLVGAGRRGVDTFIFWPDGDDPAGQVETYASEVVPAVAAALA
jgi:alkanesulfonate monooxygenase SsuD/methylene tetrahydromethanopterin reductase-like flavin-dependent oxidoreductase (luciferase family)